MPIVERTLTELKWCDHSLKNGQNENEIENGKSCTVHTKFIHFLGFVLTRSLSTLYKQKIKYIYAHSPASGSGRAFFEKYANILGFPSPAARFLSAIVCFFKARGKPEEKTYRVIEAYLPPVFLASVINMADCECQSVDRRWYTLKRPYLKSSTTKSKELSFTSTFVFITSMQC